MQFCGISRSSRVLSSINHHGGLGIENTEAHKNNHRHIFSLARLFSPFSPSGLCLKLQPLINCFLLLLTGLGTMGQNRRLTCLFFKFNGIKCETAWPPFDTNCLVGFIVVLINCPVEVVLYSVVYYVIRLKPKSKKYILVSV